MQTDEFPTPINPRQRASARSVLRAAPFGAIAAIFFTLAFGAALFSASQAGQPMSVIDEHIHYDTAVRAQHGEIPYRGMLVGPEVIREWTCGVGHQAGPLPYPCGDPRLTADVVPSGKYTAGYIHYPTYFFGAAAFASIWQATTGQSDPLDGFRAYSALTMILGVVACGLCAWKLGMRGVHVVAATALPVASPLVTFAGEILNPSSTAVLAGALIAGTGIAWVRRGSGFHWFVLATAFASIIAVTDSLPACGFAIAMLIVLVARRFGRELAPEWRLKWWHFVATALTLLAPIIIWGRIIAARATVSNEAVYSNIPTTGVRGVLAGMLNEVSRIHTPWDVGMWMTIAIFALLIAGALTRDAAPETTSLPVAATSSGIRILIIGSIIALALYPAALRGLNWLNFGFDFPIVTRYSNAFTPLLVLLLLLVVRQRWLIWCLTAAGGAVAMISVLSGIRALLRV